MVIEGSCIGPAGVQVCLRNEMTTSTCHRTCADGALQTTFTDSMGQYCFKSINESAEDLYVTGYHPKWIIKENMADVKMTEKHGCAEDLTILGFDVTGSIVDSQHNGIVGIFVLLCCCQGSNMMSEDQIFWQKYYSDEEVDLHDILTPTEVRNICLTRSKQNGTYCFPIVPPGKYSILFYEAEGESLNFKEEVKNITVKDNSLLIPPVKLSAGSQSTIVNNNERQSSLMHEPGSNSTLQTTDIDEACSELLSRLLLRNFELSLVPAANNTDAESSSTTFEKCKCL